MKTRRSPKNQDRLFRQLSGPKTTPPILVETECCFNCVSYGKSGRMREPCSLVGWTVYGATKGRGCFSRGTLP
jgi:hypothetical protein